MKKELIFKRPKKRQHKIKLSAVLLTLKKKRILPGGSSKENSQALVCGGCGECGCVGVWVCTIHTDTKASPGDKNSREGVSCFPAPFSASAESSLCANERKQL